MSEWTGESKLKRRNVDELFKQHKNYLVLGLSGKYGSGCSTVCELMTRKFSDLHVEKKCSGDLNDAYSSGDETRDKINILKYAEENWDPFDAITSGFVINSYLLEYLRRSYISGKSDEKDILTKIRSIQNNNLDSNESNHNTNELIAFFQKILKENMDEEEEKIKSYKDSIRKYANLFAFYLFKNGKATLENIYEGSQVLDTQENLFDDKSFSDESTLLFNEELSKSNSLFEYLINPLRSEDEILKVLCHLNSLIYKKYEKCEKILQENNLQDANIEIIKKNSDELLFCYAKYILPAFSKTLREKLKDFRLVYNYCANSIRAFGRIVANEEITNGLFEETEKSQKTYYFSLARRMSHFIKIFRHPTTRIKKDVPVKVVIDSIRNPYESYFLQQRYSSFYLLAILRDEEARHNSLKENGKCPADLIDIFESPKELGKLYKDFYKEIDFGEIDNIDNPNSQIQKNILEKLKKKKEISSRYTEGQLLIKCQFMEEYIHKNNLTKAVLDKKMQKFYSQNIDGCLDAADIYVTNNENEESKPNLKYSILKYVSLMMHPGIVLPTEQERCMQLAHTAKLNSGCISRQVGAVVTDSKFNIISIGWNDVPCGETSCIRRDFSNLLKGHDITAFSDFEIKKRSDFRNYLLKKYQAVETSFLNGVPASFCFKDIYQNMMSDHNQVHTRAMHAEERALLNTDVQKSDGGYLFTTSSPCELCAKKAKHYRINTIFYIVPYAGISQFHICNVGDIDNRASFQLFEGAVGKAYDQLYTPLLPLKDELELMGMLKRFEINQSNKENMVECEKDKEAD